MIIFRVDSSTLIGSGHLMRCLSLADRLHIHNVKIAFICRALEGNLISIIQGKGYKVYKLPKLEECDDSLTGYAIGLGTTQEQDAEDTGNILRELMVDCLIVDNYSIDIKWEMYIYPFVKKIMVIDDLANRYHFCDILLDCNFEVEKNNRYKDLVPNCCKQYLGLQYLCLREEFLDERLKARNRDLVRRILVSFGGSDITNETMKVLKAIFMLEENLTVDVVVGKSNPFKTMIKEWCNFHNGYNYHEQIDYIAKLMYQADLAIGAGGTTTWERCYLGLPSIVIAIAENQIEDSLLYHDKGFIWYLGESKTVSKYNISHAIRLMMQNQNLYNQIKTNGQRLFKENQIEELIKEITNIGV